MVSCLLKIKYIGGKGMKETTKNVKGITLIALVITIIILLLLTGVTVASFGETGLFSRAK